MLAYQTPNMGSYVAETDLSALQYTFVKWGTEAGKVVACDTQGERAIGILMNKPAAGETADVALPGGGAKLKCDASIAIGGLITPGTDGLGEAAALGDYVCAVGDAVGHATAANEVIPVFVVAPQVVLPA